MVQVSVITELFAVPSFDFPEPEHYERFVIQIQTAKGRRFRHYVSFPAVVPAHHEDGERFYRRDEAAQDRAQALADRVKAHLRKGGKLNQEHWGEGAPAYGSQAFIEFQDTDIASALNHIRHGGDINQVSPLVRSYL